jgi:hypothetical protein
MLQKPHHNHKFQKYIDTTFGSDILYCGIEWDFFTGKRKLFEAGKQPVTSHLAVGCV